MWRTFLRAPNTAPTERRPPRRRMMRESAIVGQSHLVPGRGNGLRRILIALPLLISLVVPTARAEDDEAQDSKTAIDKQLTNPVTTTWLLKIKNEVQFLDREGQSARGEYTLKFQPTLPLLLTPDWKLITRPEFTLIEDKPYTNSAGFSQRTTGVGDTVLDIALAPDWPHWLFGVGPTFIFPTANLDQTGQGKWQAGPDGVVGYLAKQWIAYLIAQQWWSIGGSPHRAAVSQMHLQYVASWFIGDGWSLGTSPTIKFDWKASSGNQVTFPIGPTIGKVIKFAGGGLPVKFEIQAVYAPVRPDSYGEKFAIEITVIPKIPSLIRAPLFGD